MQKERAMNDIDFNSHWLIQLKRWIIRYLTPRRRPELTKAMPPRSDARRFSNWLGRQGENYACWWLRRHCGMTIIELNYRDGPHEIDIIALDGKMLVFIEVRTISNNALYNPAESIHKPKQKSVQQGSAAWRKQHKYKGPWRIDIIGIVWPDPHSEPTQVDHWIKAF